MHATRLLGSAFSILLATGHAASADDLRFAHFMPPVAWQQGELFEAWGAAVSEASGGEVSVTVFPAQTLGKAPAGYDNAKNGVADIAWTLQGYTAGRFPLTQVIELPGLFDTAAVGSCALQKLYDSGALDAEYTETKPLFFHVHAPGHIHSKDKPVTTVADLKGMKIRRPTAVIGTLLSELGAEPVGMPAPTIYENLERGVIDGYMLPWEAVTSFRADEITGFHTEFGFYSSAFIATMNQAAYDRLSDAGKKAVDENTGMKWALVAGKGFDASDARAYPKIESSGEIYQIPEAELAEWQAAADRATALYLAELDEAGLPGTETYEAIQGFVSECEVMLN
ncbi:MAG: TRAP transporter substrate-binding protein [Pseudomonadota bacterium]